MSDTTRSPSSAFFRPVSSQSKFGVATAVLLLAILILLTPVLAIVLSWFGGIDTELWQHIASASLAEITINSLGLVFGVCTVTTILGVTLAFVTTQYEFPLRRTMALLLMLPMSFPNYVLAFIYAYHLDFSSPAYMALNEYSPALSDALLLPNYLRVVIAISLGMYPYMYLVVRQALLTQGVELIDAAKTLGVPPRQVLRKLTIPMIMPWILAGMALIAMETLADFGAVSTFAFNTYTTAIYKAWYGFFSPITAAQLSTLLMVLVFTMVSLQALAERQKKFHTPSKGSMRQRRIKLSRGKSWLLTATCALPVIFGLLFPALQLVAWSLEDITTANLTKLWPAFKATLLIGLITAAVATAVGLLFSFAFRRKAFSWLQPLARASLMGYAIPGSVLALGVYLPVVSLEKQLSPYVVRFGLEGGWLTGTLAIVVFGLVARFLTLTHSTITQAQKRIPDELGEAAAIMGVTGTNQLRKVYLPLLRKGLLTGCLLVFVDTVKELPLTLMTRPFGWDTLAIKIYQYTAEGDWDHAALPALALFLAGLLPVILLMREMEKSDD